MLLREVPELCLRMLGWHEALRRLGFLPGEIFVSPPPGACVILRAEGKQLGWDMGELRASMPAEEFVQTWPIAVAAWNKAADTKEWQEVWEKHHYRAQLVIDLLDNGFPIRRRS